MASTSRISTDGAVDASSAGPIRSWLSAMAREDGSLAVVTATYGPSDLSLADLNADGYIDLFMAAGN
jgi:hypothetical protein